jgi:hypothetical protein
MQDEPKWVQIGDRRLDRQAEDESLRGPAGPEWGDLLAAGSGMEALPFRAEAGNHGRPRQLRHGSDLAEPEAPETSPDIRIRREEARG